MFKHEPEVEEYQVKGSASLGFDTHPSASLQYLLGGFVPGRQEMSEDWKELKDIQSGLNSPVELCNALGAEFSRLRECVEQWSKLTGKLTDPEKHPKDLLGLIVNLRAARETLERQCVSACLVLQVTRQRIVKTIQTMTGIPFQLRLGVPAGLDAWQILKAEEGWKAILTALMGFPEGQDPEFANLMSRCQLLMDEIQESIREITREAKIQWINEPEQERLVCLLEWIFDLYCELQELAPVLACLQTPLEIWERSAGQSRN